MLNLCVLWYLLQWSILTFWSTCHTSLQSHWTTGFYCKFAVSHKGIRRSRAEACRCGGRGRSGMERVLEADCYTNFEMSIAYQSSEFHPCIKNNSNNQSVTLHLRMKVLTLINNYEKHTGKNGSWVILSIRHLNASLWLGIKTSLWGLSENKGILECWLLLVLLATYEDRLSLRTVSLLNRPLRTLALQPSLIPLPFDQVPFSGLKSTLSPSRGPLFPIHLSHQLHLWWVSLL